MDTQHKIQVEECGIRSFRLRVDKYIAHFRHLDYPAVNFMIVRTDVSMLSWSNPNSEIYDYDWYYEPDL